MPSPFLLSDVILASGHGAADGGADGADAKAVAKAAKAAAARTLVVGECAAHVKFAHAAGAVAALALTGRTTNVAQSMLWRGDEKPDVVLSDVRGVVDARRVAAGLARAGGWLAPAERPGFFRLLAIGFVSATCVTQIHRQKNRVRSASSRPRASHRSIVRRIEFDRRRLGRVRHTDPSSEESSSIGVVSAACVNNPKNRY